MASQVESENENPIHNRRRFPSILVQLNLRSAYVLKQVAPLSEDYYAEQLHFHWGHAHDNVNGSEHTLEGQHYPLEVDLLSEREGERNGSIDFIV